MQFIKHLQHFWMLNKPDYDLWICYFNGPNINQVSRFLTWRIFVTFTSTSMNFERVFTMMYHKKWGKQPCSLMRPIANYFTLFLLFCRRKNTIIIVRILFVIAVHKTVKCKKIDFATQKIHMKIIIKVKANLAIIPYYTKKSSDQQVFVRYVCIVICGS